MSVRRSLATSNSHPIRRLDARPRVIRLGFFQGASRICNLMPRFHYENTGQVCAFIFGDARFRQSLQALNDR